MVQVAVAVDWHRSRQDAWEKRRIVHEGRRSHLVDGNLHRALLRSDSWSFCSSFSECDGHLSEGRRSHSPSNTILCLDPSEDVGLSQSKGSVTGCGEQNSKSWQNEYNEKRIRFENKKAR